jgi:hypothetical protein
MLATVAVHVDGAIRRSAAELKDVARHRQECRRHAIYPPKIIGTFPHRNEDVVERTERPRKR